MASEKLFYMNRTKKKKKEKILGFSLFSQRGSSFCSGSSVGETWPVSEKISLFKSLLPSLSLSVPGDVSIRCEKVNTVYI